MYPPEEQINNQLRHPRPSIPFETYLPACSHSLECILVSLCRVGLLQLCELGLEEG